MAVKALITAVLLIVVGVVGYSVQEPDPVKGKSVTALIPAFFGAAIGLCGLIAFKEGLRKHAMHLAAVLALLGALGAPYPIIKRLRTGQSIDFSEPAVLSAALTTLICLVFLVLCINSFVQARKARALQQGAS